MIFDRKQQRLLLEGKEYTSDDIARFVAEGAENYPSAIWDLYLFLNEWFNDSPVITVHTSGSTGVPKELIARKDQMMQSARLTCEFLNLQAGDTALLCMNLRYIGAMMVVVRSLVAGLNLIVRPASGHPLSDISVSLKFAAMVPLQVYNTLHTREEKEQLKQTEILIIGGGAVDEALEAEIKSLPIAVYSTYGMTETLSHIALRRLNGNSASDHYYPFSSVELSLSPENTLVIKAPLVCDDILQTNDIARIYPDGSFIILGRKDNVINSGGIKIQAEEVEKLLRPFIPVPFVITSVPDPRLGQAVTLLFEGELDMEELKNKVQEILSPYHRPKYIRMVDLIPQTGNGKINRVECRTLAEKLL
ncbi:MAG: AMP-binding protein [Bacteroides acidifaciens]|uniref:AMP-binding protein n=1 Tax=Bacteroides acidifaciens TaxID=85831 RepID=UPI0023C6A6FE|nr:AMP-binding protein [Bacteroides acidifaciens]MDE6819748.1 AMP-binding protein [Bacteroides acidifaciens]MDE6986274.1 AMP-binding protein [Bacteroides acidifaciens]